MHHCVLSQRYDRVYDCTNVGTMQHTENIQFFFSVFCLCYIDEGGKEGGVLLTIIMGYGQTKQSDNHTEYE